MINCSLSDTPDFDVVKYANDKKNTSDLINSFYFIFAINHSEKTM